MVGRFDDRVRDLLDDAHGAAERGDWAAVRDLATAALALSPGNPEAEELCEAAEQGAPQSGERRQLTVMFCDVVGSTTLSHERDPELVHEVLRSYQATCDAVVRRYEGRIARYVGDGVLAYFGHPRAHEDDARRGVKAGLDLLDGLQPVVDEVRERYDLDLRIRVAVHTGLVVLADMGTATTPDRDAIVGEAPNLAARLQDHAAPGTLIISQETYELVRSWFLVSPLGELHLKGFGDAVRAYRVVEEAGDDDPVRARIDLSPFVGRDEELASLNFHWERVVDGGTGSVALTGPAGIGKSRLADVLRRRVEVDGGRTLVTACSAFHRSTALHPLRRMIERAAGIEPHLQSDLAHARLWTLVEAAGSAEHLSFLASLLELPPTEWCPAPELDGPQLREKVLAAIEAWVRATAAGGPTLFLLEDLQWADPTTEELLGRLVRAGLPGLLLAMTARDDVKVPWSSTDELALDRLSPDELTDLARRLPEGRQLPLDELERAIARSDGIPLFLEELVRTSSISMAGRAGTEHIPPALRDLLLARFAAPGVDLRMAQLLATIGAEVPLPLLSAVAQVTADRLHEELAALVDAGIVELVPGEPPTYRFRHHLLAELAYDTQLHAARRAAHLAIADALLDGKGTGVTDGPVVLAHHLERAGRTDEAILALVTAAEEAHHLAANAEVDELLARAFALLDSVPPDRRPALEFEVRLLRGSHAASILGYAAPQASEDFASCLELVDAIRTTGFADGNVDEGWIEGELVWAGSGLWAVFLIQGRLTDAAAISRAMVDQLHEGSDLHQLFDTLEGFDQIFRGDFAKGCDTLERYLEAYRGVVPSNRMALPSDPGATAHAHRAFALAAQGRASEARAEVERGLARAREVDFPRGPFTVCYVSFLAGGAELILRDIEASRVHVARGKELAERHGFTFWTIVCGYYDGFYDLYDDVEGAGDRCAAAIAVLRAIGAVVWLPSWLGSLAELQLRHGRLAEARALIEDACSTEAATEATFWSGELGRLRGELEYAEGGNGAEHLRRAADVAAQQGARLFELRALTALRRWAGEGDDDRLRALVDELRSEGETLGEELDEAVQLLDA